MNRKLMVFIKAYGIATMIGCFIVVMFTFIISTLNYVVNGEYYVVVYTNLFNEHYFEMIVLVVGFICFIYTFNKPFKKKEEDVGETIIRDEIKADSLRKYCPCCNILLDYVEKDNRYYCDFCRIVFTEGELNHG